MTEQHSFGGEAAEAFEVGRWLRNTVSSIDDVVDQRWREMKQRLGLSGRARLHAYIGYSNGTRLWASGRVLSNPPPRPPSEDDSWWDNLLSTYARWESDEIPGAEIELLVGNQAYRTISDKEGYYYFEVTLDAPLQSQPWYHATASIVSSPTGTIDASALDAVILNPSPAASLGLISDIDDTILHTGLAGLLTAARLTFLHNARTRKSLVGVAELYQAFCSGPRGHDHRNPVFYISSSAWNLFDLLSEFLQLNDIPQGPLLLRDLGFDEDKFFAEGHEHKLVKALHLLDVYPHLPFVLVGDAGQQDAELYSRLVQVRPHRILAVYIRDVDPDLTSHRDASAEIHLQAIRDCGVEALFIRNSLEIAEHAARLGIIDSQRLDTIARDCRIDRRIAQAPE